MDVLLDATQIASELGISHEKAKIEIKNAQILATATAGKKREFYSSEVIKKLSSFYNLFSVPGIKREEALILLAIQHHQYGYSSLRKMARITGLSNTTVSKYMPKLEAQGLVRQMRGVWRLGENAKLATLLADIESKLKLPEQNKVFDKEREIIPHAFRHLFWDVDTTALNVRKKHVYVIRRILELNNISAWAWVKDYYSRNEILETLEKTRYLEEKARALGEVLAGK